VLLSVEMSSYKMSGQPRTKSRKLQPLNACPCTIPIWEFSRPRNSFGQIISRTTRHHRNCSPPQPTMKVSLLSCSLLACLSPLVSATALTYKLNANEKACFFSYLENKGAKIAFYFAVSIHLYLALRFILTDTNA
jgi:hypothetical protein